MKAKIDSTIKSLKEAKEIKSEEFQNKQGEYADIIKEMNLISNKLSQVHSEGHILIHENNLLSNQIKNLQSFLGKLTYNDIQTSNSLNETYKEKIKLNISDINHIFEKINEKKSLDLEIIEIKLN